MPSDAERILAPGVPIQLNDGRSVNVRFSFRGLKMLEDSFGSIDKANVALNGGTEPVLDDKGEPIFKRDGKGELVLDKDGAPKQQMRFVAPDDKVVTTITRWIAAGLTHEKELDEDKLYDLLILRRNAIADYGKAVREALAQAFPAPEESAPKGDGAGTASSTGPDGTSSPPLRSVEATSSSGG